MDAAPPAEMLDQLKPRCDKQITSLVQNVGTNLLPQCGVVRLHACQEILAIFLAMTIFGDMEKGRRVVLYSDNKGKS